MRNPYRRDVYWLAVAVLLAGCGGGREDQAAKACSEKLAEKLTGKSYVLDQADMVAKAKSDGDTVTIASTVTIDAGLPSESKQGFECKARIAGSETTVIALTFSW
jgi:hypothetical protein